MLLLCITAAIGIVFLTLFTREVIASASQASCDLRHVRDCGLSGNREHLIREMLLGKDVNPEPLHKHDA